MSKNFAALLSLTVILAASCQENMKNENLKVYYDGVVKELSSPQYYGRSLYGDGVFKTAGFIIQELQKNGIGPCVYQAPRVNLPEVCGIFGPVGKITPEEAEKAFPAAPEEIERYFQRFAFPYNTMHGDAVFQVDGQTWNPTVDYIFKEFSPDCERSGEIVFLEDPTAYTQKSFVKVLNSTLCRGKFVVVDFDRFSRVFPAHGQEPYKTAIAPVHGAAGIIFEYDSRPPFFKSRSSYQSHCPVISVQKPFPRSAKTAYAKVNAKMEVYPGRNIIAQIPGKKEPDRFTLFVAHYDHLGLMGRENIFPGANDNASGVAMVLSLAKYLSRPENRLDESALFIFFDAEEANLHGSWFYTANPLFPLEKIKMVFDYDMVADTAEEDAPGQTLHYQASGEAISFEEALISLNGKHGWFSSLVKEELYDDSDNYPFAILGVPAMYFSVDGKYYQDYHTPRDTFNVDASKNFHSLFDYTIESLK